MYEDAHYIIGQSDESHYMYRKDAEWHHFNKETVGRVKYLLGLYRTRQLAEKQKLAEIIDMSNFKRKVRNNELLINWHYFDRHLKWFELIINFSEMLFPFQPVLYSPNSNPDFLFYNHSRAKVMYGEFKIKFIFPPPVFSTSFPNNVIVFGELINCTTDQEKGLQFMENRIAATGMSQAFLEANWKLNR